MAILGPFFFFFTSIFIIINLIFPQNILPTVIGKNIIYRYYIYSIYIIIYYLFVLIHYGNIY